MSHHNAAIVELDYCRIYRQRLTASKKIRGAFSHRDREGFYFHLRMAKAFRRWGKEIQDGPP